MKKMLFFIICIFVFVLVAQDSWSVQIVYKEGEMYAGTVTTYSGAPANVGTSNETHGWATSGGANIGYNTKGVIFYGKASANQAVGQTGNNWARFLLTTSAQSENGGSFAGFITESTARSGPNVGDMLKYELKADPGEEGKRVQLSAAAILDGTLNSDGRLYQNLNFIDGTAEIEFKFEVYDDPTEKAVISFTYSKSITNTDSDPWSTGLTELLAGLNIGNAVDSDHFMVGDSMYVYFEQTVRAIVYKDSFACKANANLMQSTDDIITVAISATTIHNPEPSSLILLGFGFLGLLIGVPGIKNKLRKDA